MFYHIISHNGKKEFMYFNTTVSFIYSFVDTMFYHIISHNGKKEFMYFNTIVLCWPPARVITIRVVRNVRRATFSGRVDAARSKRSLLVQGGQEITINVSVSWNKKHIMDILENKDKRSWLSKSICLRR